MRRLHAAAPVLAAGLAAAAHGWPVPCPCVVLMVGASGSGKSTLASWLATSGPHVGVVSYDAHQRRLPDDDGSQACTAEAVAAAHVELTQRCADGLNTVVDGTHRQPERRAAVRAIAEAHRMPVIAVVLVVPLDECLDRQHRRSRRVALHRVRAHHAAITAALPHLHSEGYAAVIVLNAPPTPPPLAASRGELL